MKKLIAFLAALCLPVFVFGCASAEEAFESLSIIPRDENSLSEPEYNLTGDIASLRIRDGSDRIIDYFIDDSQTLAAFSIIISGAAPYTGEANGLSHFWEITDAGGTKKISVIADNGIFFEGEDGLFEADSEEYFAFLNSLPEDAYNFGGHPAATLPGGGIEPRQTTYMYMRLDGSYAAPNQPDPPEDLILSDWPLTSPLPVPEFSIEPTNITLSVKLNNNIIFEGGAGNLSEAILESGSRYEITATAEFHGPYTSGEAVYSYFVETEKPPETLIEALGAETFPGEAVILRVENYAEETPPVCASQIANNVTFYPDGEGSWTALFPVSYVTGPGEYYADITAGELSERILITVINKQFEEQHLIMSEETTSETLESDEANNEYNRLYYPLRFEADPVRYWQGRFISPVEGGEITTPFAVMRYTNDDPVPARHGALDIALPTGSPVRAPNRGRVQFAGFLTLTGNSVMIEHGLGLKTWYYHMDSVAVATGDIVGQGQKIGEVGSTGYSTGPHLHYGMSVRDVMINPDTAGLSDIFDF